MKKTRNIKAQILCFVLLSYTLLYKAQVGIGTTSIDGTLHIDNTTSDTYMIIEKDETTTAYVKYDNAGTVKASFGLDASENLVFDSDEQDKDIYFRVNAGGVDYNILYADASLKSVGMLGSASNCELYLYNPTVSVLKIQGTTTSNTVGAELKLYSAADYRGRGMRISPDSDSQWWMGVPYTGDGFSIGRHASQPEYDANANLFINESGYVGINDNSPSYRLEVNTDAASSYVSYIFNDGNNTDREGIGIQCGADDGLGTNVFMQLLDGDGTDMGGFHRSGGAMGLFQSSDRRLKTHIKDSETNGLEIINALQVRDFNWKTAPNEEPVTGFIAQEVKKVYPRIVGKTSSKSSKRYFTLSPESLLPVITKAVQEQDRQLSQLQEQSDKNKELLESLLNK